MMIRFLSQFLWPFITKRLENKRFQICVTFSQNYMFPIFTTFFQIARISTLSLWELVENGSLIRNTLYNMVYTNYIMALKITSKQICFNFFKKNINVSADLTYSGKLFHIVGAAWAEDLVAKVFNVVFLTASKFLLIERSDLWIISYNYVF